MMIVCCGIVVAGKQWKGKKDGNRVAAIASISEVAMHMMMTKTYSKEIVYFFLAVCAMITH